MKQNMQALALATKTRLGREKVKRDLKAGVIDVRDLIYDPPVSIEGATVFDLLKSKKGVGIFNARKVCRRVQITEFTTVRKLTTRQRNNLMRELA